MTSDSEDETQDRLPEPLEKTSPAPLTGEILPVTPSRPPIVIDASDDGSMLRNPYALAGFAVAGAIVMAVLVVILFGGGGASTGGASSSDVKVYALSPIAGRGVSAKSIAIATVREGPSPEYYEIAPLRSGQDLEVIGRNADGTWLEIYYPAGSQLKGWVPASALRLPAGTSETLAIVAVTPIPRPAIVLPTSTPEPPMTPSPTATAAVTPGPDLAISLVGTCQAGSPLTVSVRNVGTVPIVNRQARITVATAAGVQGVADQVLNLQPDASVNIATNQAVQPPRTLARVDLLGAPTDVNAANNSVECAVAGGAPSTPPAPPVFPSPTPTRPPATATQQSQ